MSEVEFEAPKEIGPPGEKKVNAIFRYEGKANKVILVGEWSNWKEEVTLASKGDGNLFTVELV